MTRYLLDSDIVSKIAWPEPSASLLNWMEVQRDEDLFMASLTIAEVWRSILELPNGRQRDGHETWFTGEDGPQVLFAG